MKAIDEITQSIDERIKSFQKRYDHMCETVKLTREKLLFKTHQLTEDAWMIEYREVFYLFTQDDTKYTISKINGTEEIEIIYNQEWMGEPFEIVQEIANHFNIDAAITGNE